MAISKHVYEDTDGPLLLFSSKAWLDMTSLFAVSCLFFFTAAMEGRLL